MTFGTIVFSFGVLFFFGMWLYETFDSIKNLINHWGFRITTDTSVEFEFLEKNIEKIFRRVIREEMSEIMIRYLNKKDEEKK